MSTGITKAGSAAMAASIFAPAEMALCVGSEPVTEWQPYDITVNTPFQPTSKVTANGLTIRSTRDPATHIRFAFALGRAETLDPALGHIVTPPPPGEWIVAYKPDFTL